MLQCILNDLYFSGVCADKMLDGRDSCPVFVPIQSIPDGQNQVPLFFSHLRPSQMCDIREEKI